MARFSVWAPIPAIVELECHGRRHAMNKAEEGWWEAEVDAGPGASYGFCLDGSPPFPDPRSPSQPRGAHGLSCTVDHRAFVWTDHHWQARPLASAIIYELHPGTFSPEGTFEGAIGRLDNLVELGVTHLELMPVNQFSGQWGWGYDGVQLYAPHHAYGSPDDLKSLVDAAHGKGLAVLLDVVYNHLGPSGNHLGKFGPYFTSRHRTPWGEAVNLDGPNSGQVRRFFIENALMWLRDYHFDGLRIDAIHSLIDSSALHFIEELAEETHQLGIELGRHLVLIAESDLNDPRVVRPRDMCGFGIDAQWSDDFHHALHVLLTGERAGYYCDFGKVAHLAKALSEVFVYDGSYSAFRQRVHGRPVRLLPGNKFIACIQNHDQVGNRATGDRISHIVNHRRAMLAAGVVLTSPFVPMIFQGEEWGASTPFQYFTQHEEEWLGRAVSEGRQAEFEAFGWHPSNVPDPQNPETFLRSKLRWEERFDGDHAEMFRWYQQIIRLRRSSRHLSHGDLERLAVRWSEDPPWIQYDRGPLTISCNFSAGPVSLTVARPGTVLAACGDAGLEDGHVVLGPESFAVTGPDEQE